MSMKVRNCPEGDFDGVLKVPRLYKTQSPFKQKLSACFLPTVWFRFFVSFLLPLMMVCSLSDAVYLLVWDGMLKFSWKLFSFGLLFLGLFVLAVALLLNIKKLRNTDFYLLKVFLVAAAFVFPLNNIASDLMMGKLYAQEYFLSFAGGYVFFTLPNLVYFSRRSFVFGIGEPCVYITNLSDSVCRGLWKISLWGLAAAFVFSKIIYFLI